MDELYEKSASFYDAIFAKRHDYPGEVDQLHRLIATHKLGSGNRLLDLACGTGAYIPQLQRHYQVEGLDLNEAMLAVARQRHPEVLFHRGDLVTFDLGRQFDVIVCLGSSIGYVRTLPRLQQAMRTMARHVVGGGVVVVEPWFSPEVWEPGRLTADLTDAPDLKLARVLVSDIDDTGTVSTLDIHHLVGTQDGVDVFVERHEMGLFTHDEYLAAFAAAVLAVTHDAMGLIGRGLYLGVKG